MVSPVIEATDRCRSCGDDLSAKARFCDVCGSPVSPRSATGEPRRDPQERRQLIHLMNHYRHRRSCAYRNMLGE